MCIRVRGVCQVDVMLTCVVPVFQFCPQSAVLDSKILPYYWLSLLYLISSKILPQYWRRSKLLVSIKCLWKCGGSTNYVTKPSAGRSTGRATDCGAFWEKIIFSKKFSDIFFFNKRSGGQKEYGKNYGMNDLKNVRVCFKQKI